MNTHTFTVLLLSCFMSNLYAQIQLLNDEFDHAITLDANWLNINDTENWGAEQLEVHDINTSEAGHLYMMPHTSSWYQNYRGTLLYRLVGQNFVFTTEITATNRAGNNIPGPSFSLAGIMVRTPRNFPNGALNDWTPGDENYIFLSTGFANGGTGPHLEVKTTTNSNSNLGITGISTSSNVQIRVARIDAEFIVLYRLPGEAWVLHQRYTRPDFPDELQVGFVTYTDWQKVSSYDPFFQNSHVLNNNLNPDPTAGTPFSPDLIGRFDFGRFDDIPAGLPAIIGTGSNADILAFLSYDSEPFCPPSLHITDAIRNGNIVFAKAENIITAENTISESAEVRYRAGNTVELQMGFQAESSVDFSVEIE